MDVAFALTASFLHFTGKKCISDTAAEGCNLPRDNNHGMASLDMLKDDIVSEHLTRYYRFLI